MTATVFGPGSLQWAGVATETTYGTAQTVPTIWIPVDSPVFTPGLTMLVDGALRGSMAGEYQQVGGLRVDTVTFKTYFYLDSVFALFRQMLGLPDTISGTGDPYTHKTSLQNTGNNGQPAGTTVFFNAMDKTWQMPGAIMTSLKVTLNSAALATLDVTYMGLPATPISAPTNTPTTAVPMPSWNSVVTLGGTAFNNFSDVGFTFTRSTKAIDVLNGTQAPGAIAAGALTVALDITAVYQGSTDPNLVNYITNVQPTLVVKTSPVGDAVHSITVQCSKIGYDKSSFSATTDFFELKATGRALANTTDALGGNFSPALVTLLSPTSTVI
jgi:hypothetical protein